MNDPAAILRSVSTIAVVGISDKPERPSNEVARYLMAAGYRVFPVNPTLDEVLGERCYPNLMSIPEEGGVDLVDIFRASEHVEPIVEEAISIGARAVWMQEGVVNEAAAQAAGPAAAAAPMAAVICCSALAKSSSPARAVIWSCHRSR